MRAPVVGSNWSGDVDVAADFRDTSGPVFCRDRATGMRLHGLDGANVPITAK